LAHFTGPGRDALFALRAPSAPVEPSRPAVVDGPVAPCTAAATSGSLTVRGFALAAALLVGAAASPALAEDIGADDAEKKAITGLLRPSAEDDAVSADVLEERQAGKADPGLPDEAANVDGILDDILRNQDGRNPRDGEMRDPLPSGEDDADSAEGANDTVTDDGVDDAASGAPAVLRPQLTDDGVNYDQPYDPIGVRLGSFRLYPSVTVDETFDSNVFRVGNGANSDWYMALRPSLIARSDWSRHAVEAEVSADHTTYDRFDEEDSLSYDAALRGRLDVTERGVLSGEIGASSETRSRGGFDAPSRAAGPAAVTRQRGSVSYEQRFNRLVGRASARGSVTDEGVAAALVTDPLVCAGATPPPECLAVSQRFSDRALGLRLGYEWSGALTLYVEGEGNDRGYDEDVGSTERDSAGYTVKVGVDADFGPLLRGGLALGYAEQTPTDGKLASLKGMLIDADLTWAPTALTTITLKAGTGITTTAQEKSIGALETSGEIAIRHEFRRWLAGLASVGYAQRNYAGIALVETEATAKLGLEYAIDSRWALLAEYSHVDFVSSVENRDYTADSIRVGLRAQK
jgi:hypothetical protein